MSIKSTPSKSSHTLTVAAEKDEDSICPDLLLYRCVAHFMGRKAPGPSVDSIESVQKPLIEIYSVDPCSCLAKDIARDVYLLVFTSGIYAIPINPIDPKIWIQIQNFRNCTAVKGVSKVYNPDNVTSLVFKPLDSPEALASPLPGIFTITAARGNCVPLLDCYIFSCPSNDVALNLVSKTRQAFSNRRGWSNNPRPPPVSMLDLDENFTGEKWQCRREDNVQEVGEFVNPELYQKPSLHGFYYAPKEDLIRTFDIGLEAEAYPIPQLNVHSPPPEPCPRYLIINQDQAPEVSQIQASQQPANIQITVNQFGDEDFQHSGQQQWQTYGYVPQSAGVTANPYNMVELNQWLADYKPSSANGYQPVTATIPTATTTAYPYADQAYSASAQPVPPYTILPAGGFYPAIVVDQPIQAGYPSNATQPIQNVARAK